MPLVALSALLFACAAPRPGMDEQPPAPVQGYVSAALLGHWCRSALPVDVEACLSYLRGNFDSLATWPMAGGPCIPPTVAVTELRERVREREAGTGDASRPAARMLADLWREHYPCRPGTARQPADGM